jgi:hypothetical protein
MYIVSIIFLSIGGLLAIINGWILFQQLQGQPLPSAVPILGGVFLFIGTLIFPCGALRAWAVLGLFVDYGCMPYLIYGSIYMVQETRRYAEKNRILSLEYEANECTGKIYIYPRNEGIYKWAARDGQSHGSIIMKVDEYVPGQTLKLSIQDTAIWLGVHDGTWQLDSEKGWHNTMYSLVNSTITELAANKVLN